MEGWRGAPGWVGSVSEPPLKSPLVQGGTLFSLNVAPQRGMKNSEEIREGEAPAELRSRKPLIQHGSAGASPSHTMPIGIFSQFQGLEVRGRVNGWLIHQGSNVCGLMLALMLCFVGTPRGIAAPVEQYSGVMTLPIDLFTQDGTKIEKGRHEVEVKSEGTVWTLSFLAEGKSRAVVKGATATGDPFLLPAIIPVMGTHYMRSSSEPLKTAQERQFSKTGQPQYAEQERSWKATLRVYKSLPEPGGVIFIFQVRNATGKVTRADFKLRTEVLHEKR
jgi:hypothetical protein